MTALKRTWVLLCLAAFACGTGASAQDLFLPPLSDIGVPDESVLISPENPFAPALPPYLTPELVEPEDVEGLEIPFEEPFEHAESHGLWGQEAVPLESTGTWLRRGFWYSEADAVVMNRFVNKFSVRLASDGGTLPPFPLTNRFLVVQGRHPGADAAVRWTLGRFLFRDMQNRDHTVEFTVFGGGDWEQQSVVTSRNPNGLIVPFGIDRGNLSFDNSSRMFMNYSSRFNSFELNYRVKRRMDRDQMVMEPSGQWVRRANQTITRDFLAGLRLFDLTERFNWFAQDILINGNNEDGEYFIRTDNNLVGMQLGTGISFETARWSVGTHGKAGVFVTDAKARPRMTVTNTPERDFDYRMAEEQISFIGEHSLTVKYHIQPNFSIRAGYELMYVTSVALAVHQITFIPEYAQMSTSGDPFYHGFSVGFEGYW